MKKFMVIMIVIACCVLPVFADVISYDKKDFAEIYTVIDDAA